MAGFGHSEDGLQPGCPPGSAGRRGGGVRGGAGGAQIHDTAALTQSARSADVVVDHVRDQLIGLLGLDGSRFEYGTLLGHPPRLEPDGTISMTGHAGGMSSSAACPARRSSCGPSATASTTAGSCSSPSPAPGPHGKARLVAVTLANQAGRARRQPGCPQLTITGQIKISSLRRRLTKPRRPYRRPADSIPPPSWDVRLSAGGACALPFRSHGHGVASDRSFPGAQASPAGAECRYHDLSAGGRRLQ